MNFLKLCSAIDLLQLSNRAKVSTWTSRFYTLTSTKWNYFTRFRARGNPVKWSFSAISATSEHVTREKTVSLVCIEGQCLRKKNPSAKSNFLQTNVWRLGFHVLVLIRIRCYVAHLSVRSQSFVILMHSDSRLNMHELVYILAWLPIKSSINSGLFLPFPLVANGDAIPERVVDAFFCNMQPQLVLKKSCFLVGYVLVPSDFVVRLAA